MSTEVESIIVGIIVIVGLAGGLVWFVERTKRIWRGRAVAGVGEDG